MPAHYREIQFMDERTRVVVIVGVARFGGHTNTHNSHKA